MKNELKNMSPQEREPKKIQVDVAKWLKLNELKEAQLPSLIDFANLTHIAWDGKHSILVNGKDIGEMKRTEDDPKTYDILSEGRVIYTKEFGEFVETWEITVTPETIVEIVEKN